MTRKALFAATAIAIAISPVAPRAAEINESGARTLLDSLTYYLPKSVNDSGFLTVTPGAQRYELRMDFAALLKDVDPKIFVIEGLKPMSYYLTPQEDGLWKAELNDRLDVSGSFVAEGKTSTFVYKIDKMSGEALFDPAVSFFRSSTAAYENIAITSQTGPEMMDIAVAKAAQDMRLENVVGGRGDLVSNFSLSGLSETINSPGQAGQVRIDAASMDGRVQMDKAGLAPMRDLVVFVLDLVKSGQKNLTAEQSAKLKGLIRANVPLVDNLVEDIHIRDVKVNASNMTFSAADIGYKIAFNGIKPDSRFEFEVSATDPSAPAGLLPPGTEAAMPKSLSFGMAMRDLNLEGVMTYLADNADFTKDAALTPQQSEELGKIVLPSGKMNFEFTNVAAKSDVYDIALTGSMQVDQAQSDKPNVNVDIIARDFDKTVKFLQDNAATVPDFGQAAFMALMMKGFGREQPDGSILWNVKMGADGQVIINGQPMKM
ncbi:hypothetical protein M2360_002372 [Rhizobium sp. SG_E_25_P2]|uniref:hypothetical protein n=1 Tax=Rhizobium sp. SG_E_25_P2 TaxID=2879942 RepID=UPI0024742133|nr:hypothetical protein [Rhizobium sp. SG_E_25_P2]MDH6266975.1 hypothetical protein [Rhizobium sp. SG_E_25_P2]